MCHGALFRKIRKSCKGSDGERKHEKNKDTPWTHQLCLFSCLLSIWEQPAKRNLQQANHIQRKVWEKGWQQQITRGQQWKFLWGSFFHSKPKPAGFWALQKGEKRWKTQKPDLSGFQAEKHKNIQKQSKNIPRYPKNMHRTYQNHSQNHPKNPNPKNHSQN